jgi:transposase
MIPNLNPEQLVFQDESSINLAFTRLYGRAPKNKRIKEGIKDVRFQRKSVLSTMRLSGEKCTMVFDGTLNKFLMREWILTQLAPSWKSGDIFVMDNSSVHKSKLVRDTFTQCGITVLYLPRYSPDLNPIELMWTNIKSRLKKTKARTSEKLDKALLLALDAVELEFINNWFHHCGYRL